MDIARTAVEDAMDLASIDVEALHEDYSGRGMYGSTCPALYIDSPSDAYAFIAALAVEHEDPDLIVRIARSTRTDQLGLGIVVYWPGLHLT